MSVESQLKFIFFWGLIIIPFLAGAILNGRLVNPGKTAKTLINLNLSTLEPVILLWTIWGLKPERELLILPLFGMLTVLTGFLIARLFTPLLKLDRIGRASYIISSSLSNQGMTMGGLLCFMVAGERGLALASIYIIYYLPFVFAVIFPYAKISSLQAQSPATVASFFTLRRLKSFFINFQNLPLAGIFFAVILQAAGIRRPVIYFPLEIFLSLAIALYYLTLGINFKIGDLTSCKRELAAISITRFILIPAITLFILQFTDFDKTIELVILLQSFAPAAIYSVISSILFGLDSRMTSGIFVMNSLIFLFCVMPLLMLFNDALVK
ncbi:MAG TPA: hypothetical protein PK986_00400 [Spirochaetota bacterium]|nr:hypothetical protein [Spirochaetota bacterium]